jgi:RNA polymerase sigma-70 factor (ECF subfamily)
MQWNEAKWRAWKAALTPRIRGYCRRFTQDAEAIDDFVSEVIAELVVRDRTDPAVTDVWPAARTVLRRLCAAEKRLERAHQLLAREHSEPRGGDEEYEPDVQQHRLAWMYTAMTALTPRQRQAVDLHILQGLHYSTTAARMSTSEGAVRVHVHAALKRLRTLATREAARADSYS